MKKSYSTKCCVAQDWDVDVNILFEIAEEEPLMSFLKKCTEVPDFGKWLRYSLRKQFYNVYSFLLQKQPLSLEDIVLCTSMAYPNAFRSLAHEHLYDHELKDILEQDQKEAFEKIKLTGYKIQEYLDTKGTTFADLFIRHNSLLIWESLCREGVVSSTIASGLKQPFYRVWKTVRQELCKEDLFLLIRDNKKESVQTWIREQRPINQRNVFGVTPLYEAVRQGRQDIADLLRDAGAMLCSPVDAQQLWMTTMTKKSYFSRIAFLLRDVFSKMFFEGCEVAVFFHTSRGSSRLFCCSVSYLRNPKDEQMLDFHRRLSHYVIDRKDDPYRALCKEFGLSASNQVPLFSSINEQLLGVFVAFSHSDFNPPPMVPDTVIQNLFLHQFSRLCSSHFNSLWEKCLLSSSVFWEWLQQMIVCASSEGSCIFQHPLEQLVPLMEFLGSRLSFKMRKTLDNIFTTHAHCAIPFTSTSCVVLHLTQSYKTTRLEGPSFLLQKIKTSPILYRLERVSGPSSPLKLLSPFDLFEILGHGRPPLCPEQVKRINAWIDPSLRFSSDLLVTIRQVLGFPPECRQQPVIGTFAAPSPHYRIFLPFEEIPGALDYIFQKARTDPSEHDLATCYKLLVEWVHPFQDGNGRTFRLLFTLLFRSRGFTFILTKGDPLIRRTQ